MPQAAHTQDAACLCLGLLHGITTLHFASAHTPTNQLHACITNAQLLSADMHVDPGLTYSVVLQPMHRLPAYPGRLQGVRKG